VLLLLEQFARGGEGEEEEDEDDGDQEGSVDGAEVEYKSGGSQGLEDVVEEDYETLVDELDLNASQESQESQGSQGSFYDFKGNKFEKKDLSDAIPSPLELVRKSSRVSSNESSISPDSVFVSSKALDSLLGESSSEGSDREEDDTLPPNPNSRTLNLPSRSLRLSPKGPVKPSRYSSFVGRGRLDSPIAAVAKTNKAIRDMNPSPERVGIAPLILPRMREGEDQIGKGCEDSSSEDEEDNDSLEI